jgi:hypothetical protein
VVVQNSNNLLSCYVIALPSDTGTPLVGVHGRITYSNQVSRRLSARKDCEESVSLVTRLFNWISENCRSEIFEIVAHQ